MLYYFSGATDDDTQRLLRCANVDHILVDQHHLLASASWPGHSILDCGSYAAWKKGETIQPAEYIRRIRPLFDRFDFVIAGDVLGDPDTTMAWWTQYFRPGASTDGLSYVPVWQWDAPAEHLEQYLTDAPIVAVGGCVPWMRKNRGEPRHPQAEKNLRRLCNLAKANPDRFHVLGLCWPKAIETLAPYLYSADSSHWLARRNGLITFVHSGHGKLTHGPANQIAEYKDLSPEDWCIISAYNIANFCQQQPQFDTA